jgi:hypothetical protein
VIADLVETDFSGIDGPACGFSPSVRDSLHASPEMREESHPTITSAQFRDIIFVVVVVLLLLFLRLFKNFRPYPNHLALQRQGCRWANKGLETRLLGREGARSGPNHRFLVDWYVFIITILSFLALL